MVASIVAAHIRVHMAPLTRSDWDQYERHGSISMIRESVGDAADVGMCVLTSHMKSRTFVADPFATPSTG
eukprot:6009233-Amphidinium_carterae.1